VDVPEQEPECEPGQLPSLAESDGGDADGGEVDEWFPGLPEDVPGRPSLGDYQKK